MSVQITPGRELESEPSRGTLPCALTLLFFASATSGSETVDVVYRIVETAGQSLHVGFAGDDGSGSLTLRKSGVALTALPQAIDEHVRLVDTGGARPPLLVVLQASLVEPDAPDDADALDRTASVVRIEAPAAGGATAFAEPTPVAPASMGGEP